MNNNNLNINFNEGYKDFTINDDPKRILHVNIGDFNVLVRMKESARKLGDKSKELSDKGIKINAQGKTVGDDEIIELVKGLNDELRKEFDEIFHEGAADAVFGRQNPLAIVNGVTIYERFMLAFARTLKPYFEEEMQAAKKHTDKYKEDYDRIAAEIVED